MSGQWHAGNLPSEQTSLVGRRAELDEVRRACGRSRLVTLTGVDGWLGPDQIVWYDRVIGEHHNLRAALENALAAKDAVPALELAGTLAFFWYGCGYVKEGRHHLGQALSLEAPPGPVLAQALWADGLPAATQGDADDAEARAAQCETAAGSGDAYARMCVSALRAEAGGIRGDLTQVMAASEAAYRSRHDGDHTIAQLVSLLYALQREGEGLLPNGGQPV